MRPPRSRAAAAGTLGVLAALALAGCSATTQDDADPAAEPQAAVTPAALPTPRSAPSPAATLSPAAGEGEVRVEEGPFTDRVRMTRLTLTDTPAVTGHLAITSDVSDVIALELRAAYYDTHGRLLGTGSFEYQEEGEDTDGTEHHDGARAAGDGIDFTVPAKDLTGTPTAAVISVPVLVNE